MGLYHDDGIIYIPNSNGPNISHIQQKIIRAFKFLGFKIEVSSNNKIVNFLDGTRNLSNNIYKPFLKTDQYPSYINANSNHPKNIIKQVPKAVKLRIRDLSAKGKIFKESSKIYHHHHHHVVPSARISLTLFRHFSLSFIASGRSSGLHPVSSHSCCMYVRAGRPAFARAYVGVHRSTSLMSSSLLLQLCPACLVRLA